MTKIRNLLFSAYPYDFYDDGYAYNFVRAKNLSRHAMPIPYAVEPEDNPGDPVRVFWVWSDGTRSLAPCDVQEAYQQYVARMVVE